jgi:hypothetical protein
LLTVRPDYIATTKAADEALATAIRQLENRQLMRRMSSEPFGNQIIRQDCASLYLDYSIRAFDNDFLLRPYIRSRPLYYLG